MSDRTWNGIDGRIWDEDWPLSAMVAMAFIVSRCPNQLGIYKLPLGAMKRVMAEKWTADEVVEAVAFLASDGCIKLYRQDTVVWLVNKFERERGLVPANERHVKYVKSELSRYHEVRDAFLSRYHDYKIGIESLSDSDSETMPTTDPDPDPDPEKNNITRKRTVKYVTSTLSDLDLHQLESKCKWLPSWEDWKQARITASDAGKVTETGLASDLRKLLARQDAYGLDNKAMAHGIELAIQRGALNTNYVIKVATGYNPLAGLPNSAYYGEPKQAPLPPVQPGPDDIVIGD